MTVLSRCKSPKEIKTPAEIMTIPSVLDNSLLSTKFFETLSRALFPYLEIHLLPKVEGHKNHKGNGKVWQHLNCGFQPKS